MSTLPIVSFMALPVASLVLAHTNRILVEAHVGLVMAVTFVWLLVFWATALDVVWPFVAKLMQTAPLIIQLVQLLAH